MAIKVKAVERNVSFDKTKEKWAYVMQAEPLQQALAEQSNQRGQPALRHHPRLD